jgi:hypothetical protein
LLAALKGTTCALCQEADAHLLELGSNASSGPAAGTPLVKCMMLFLLVSEEFLKSNLLLLRTVLVFLPMEPEWLHRGPSRCPLGKSNLYSETCIGNEYVCPALLHLPNHEASVWSKSKRQ